jgi:2-haloacid dehalogenase
LSCTQVVSFDAVEILFALDPMRQRLSDLGLSEEALELFFARLLRNGFALDASGTFKPFVEVARATLGGMLAANDIAIEDGRIDHALAGFGELPAHPDVAPALRLVREAGVPIVVLTNGSADNTRRLLEQAGLLEHVGRIISIDEVRHWKPRREVYLHAADVAGVPPGQLALVAAHAWDIHGASQAGLITGWVSRLEKRFDPSMNPPDATGDTLVSVCRKLLEPSDSPSPMTG